MSLQVSEISAIVIVMTDTVTEIANRVRGVAAEKRFTQQRIASELELARSSVSQRISGAVPFTGAELSRLAKAMNVPVSRFFPEDAAQKAVA